MAVCGEKRRVRETEYGFRVYRGMVGTVTRTFEVAPFEGSSRQKIWLSFSERPSSHGDWNWTPLDLEIFTDLTDAVICSYCGSPETPGHAMEWGCN